MNINGKIISTLSEVVVDGIVYKVSHLNSGFNIFDVNDEFLGAVDIDPFAGEYYHVSDCDGEHYGSMHVNCFSDDGGVILWGVACLVSF